jgi:4-amino-4-deoxy-L-arabinose transferase-like glycosyltransferase
MGPASVTWIVQRLTRGALATGVGAAVLLLALALPWISLPGGPFAHQILSIRGEAIPATGSAWRSLPLLSVMLMGLAALGALVTVVSVAATKWRVVLAGVTCGYGLLVLAALVVKLFADRVADDLTAIGAGGYLGVAAVIVIVVGAATVVSDIRLGRRHRTRRTARAEPSAFAPPPTPRGRSWIWVAAAAATILGGYVATRMSFVDRFPYFFDEGIYADYARLATESRADLFIALEIGQGPLVTWLSAAGVELGLPPVTAVRLVSVTAGLLTVPVVGLLARTLWDTTTGWVAAALCVVLPFFVVHDGIGIYEPLVTLIMSSALLLQITLARRPDLRLAALLGLVLAAGLLTKQNTLPALALLPVSLLCFDWSQRELRRRLTLWLSGVAIVIFMVAAADAVQRTSPYWDEREKAVNDILVWPVRSVQSVLDDPFALLDQNWAIYRPALVGYVTIPLLLAAGAGALFAWRRDRRVVALLLAWIVVPFFVGMLFQLRPAPRHAMFLAPPLLVLAAHALVQSARLAGQRLSRRAALVACAIGAAVVLAPAVALDVRVLTHPASARYPGRDYWQYVAGWPAGGPWRKAANLIERRASGAKVLVLTPGRYPLLRLSLNDSDRYAFTDPNGPDAARAQFAVYDSGGFPVEPKEFPERVAKQGYVGLARFARPGNPCSAPPGSSCGGSVVVLERH